MKIGLSPTEDELLEIDSEKCHYQPSRTLLRALDKCHQITNCFLESLLQLILSKEQHLSGYQ